MESRVKTTVKQLIPPWLRRLRTKWIISRQRRVNQNRPIKDVFDEIYRQNQWGGTEGELWSGPGSVGSAASVYAETIRNFIQKNGITRVLDLGCGDFFIGRLLQIDGVHYTGVDIAKSVIERNQRAFSTSNTTFLARDILTDDLPDADLCLVRQVIQHLSNDQIMTVLQNIVFSKKYRFVIITEHYPAPSVKAVPNLDKPHGPDTRIADNSAVYLDQPPFNVSNLQMILEVETPDYLVYKGEKIRSFLIESTG